MGWTARPRFDKSRRSWYCRYRNRKHYLGTDYPQAVQRFAEIVRQAPDPEAPETVAEAIEGWLRLNPGRWHDEMLRAWPHFVGATPLHRCDQPHLDQYRDHLIGKSLSPQTVRHYVRHAVVVLKWCAERGWITWTPKMPRTPKPMRHPQDISAEQMAEAFSDLRPYADRILRFIAETGCRPGEACRLEWEHVNLDRQVAVLPQHKKASSGKPRAIYFTPGALDILDSVPMPDDQERTGLVFLSSRDKPYTPAGLRSILRRRGISRVYALRHTRAQTALDQGASMEDVAKLLGHANLQTVQVYAQVRDDRAREVAATLTSPVPPRPVSHSKRRASRGASGATGPSRGRGRQRTRGKSAKGPGK